MFIRFMLVLIALVTFSATTSAEEVRLSFNPGLTLPVNTTGKASAPLSTNFLVLVKPFSEHWLGVMKLGFATPTATVQPAPQVAFGGAVKATDSFGVGATIGYKLIPHWDGTPSVSHVVGAVVAPFFPIAKSPVTLFFPIGPTYNVTTKTASVGVGFEVGITFAKL